MADVNFGLLNTNVAQPYPIKTPIDAYNTAAATDLTRAQTDYANAQAQAQQQDVAIKKLSTINQLAASLLYNPTQENLDAIKQTAKAAGIDVSSIPDDINSALPMAKNAYFSTGQALEVAKANAQLKMAGATLGVKADQNQISAIKGASDAYNQGTPYSSAYSAYLTNGGPPSQQIMNAAGLQGFPSVGIPLMGGGEQNTQAQGQNPQMGAPLPQTATPQPITSQSSQNNLPAYLNQSSQNVNPALANYPGLQNLASRTLIFPADKKAQEQQGEDWAKMMSGLATSSSKHFDIQNALTDIEDAEKDRVGGNYAGFLPEAFLSNTPAGRRIDKDSKYLFTNVIQNVAQSGIGRLDIPIVNAILGSLPTSSQYTSINLAIKKKFGAGEYVVSQIMAPVAAKLDQLGLQNKLLLSNITNEIVKRTGAYNEKTGDIDLDKLKNWQKPFGDILDPRTAQTKDGKTISYGDFYSKMQAANPNATENQINQIWNQKYLAPQQQSTSQMGNDQQGFNPAQTTMPMNNAQMQQVISRVKGMTSVPLQNDPYTPGPIETPHMQNLSASLQSNNMQPQQNANQPAFQFQVQKLANAIAKQESGGNYGAVSRYPDRNGDHAYGKYQVLGANIPVWTRQVLGRPLSVQQFLASPQAQDAVALAKLGEMVSKTGSLEDGAAMWFSGRPLRGNTSRDLSGYSVPQYIRSVGKNYAGI